jgi:hypothetical protein
MEVLKPGLKDALTDPADRVIVRYYIVALKKMQQDDEILYDKLIASDATEKHKTDQLLNQ